METFWLDLRFGLRLLLKKPGFTLIAVLSLALGIGANTAIFSLLDAVLLKPLPFREPDRLVMVWEDASRIGFPRNTPAPANYADWKAQNQVFEDMAAIAGRSFNLTGDGEPERIQGQAVTANFQSCLLSQKLKARRHDADDRVLLTIEQNIGAHHPRIAAKPSLPQTVTDQRNLAAARLVPAVLIVVALAACSVPARRAIKTDPMVALRYE